MLKRFTILSVVAPMVVMGGLRAQQQPAPELSQVGDTLPALYLSTAQAESFKLDGFLGEEFWADAQMIDDFRQRDDVQRQRTRR